MAELPRWLGIALPCIVAVQRLAELVWSRRNTRRSAPLPGHTAEARAAFAAMVAAHVGLVLLPALEAWFLPARWPPVLGWGALVTFLLAQALRYWAIRALGTAWNVRAHVTPDLGVSTRGPYRWIRHPNYLAVLVEFSAVPLALGAWRSWIVLNLLHTPVLARRIQREEALLFRVPGYAQAMRAKGRLLPRLGRGEEAHA